MAELIWSLDIIARFIIGVYVILVGVTWALRGLSWVLHKIIETRGA